MLRSLALKYTKADLDSSVEALREEKKQKELPQDEDTSSIEIKKEETAASQSSQVKLRQRIRCYGPSRT